MCTVVSVSVCCGVCGCVLWCLCVYCGVCVYCGIGVYCGDCVYCGVCQCMLWSGEGAGVKGELIQNGFIFVLIVPLTVPKSFWYSTDLQVKQVLLPQLELFGVGDV